MLHLLLALIYLSSAQLWPLDFAEDDTATAVGDDVWLAPGKHSVPISGDYSAAYIEFTFKSVYASHSCEYQVWADGNKVYTGSFRNAVATTIPSMLGTFPAGTEEITVWTNGCWLNRHALPFTLGENGNVLYLYDIRPATAANGAIPLVDGVNVDFGVPFPTDQASFLGLVNYLSESNIGQSGTGSFSSQIGNFDQQDGWFFNSYNSETVVLVDWSNLAPFNAAGAEFVFEIGQFAKAGYDAQNQYFTCNTSAPTGCGDVDVFNDNSFLLYSSEMNANDAEHSRMYFYDYEERQSEATTLKVLNEYVLVDEDWPADLAQTIGQYASGTNFVIYVPYVKIWNLDASLTDANHVVVDLRATTNPATSAGDCVYRTVNPDPAFYSDVIYNGEGGLGDFVSGGMFPWNIIPAASLTAGTVLGGFLQCPNDASGLLATPVAPCTDLSNLVDNTESVVTTAQDVTINMPNGAIMRVPIYDAGLKAIQQGACATGGWDSFYLSQVSWFDVSYDGQVSGTVGQAVVTNNFQGRAIHWGTYESFFIDTTTTDGAPLVFTSKPGFSIDLHPFLFIHGLAPTSGNESACDPTACLNGGVCARASSSALCINPEEQGGEPRQNEDFATIITQGTWVGTFYGPTNAELVPFCTPDTCWNGGECVENDARTWNAELFGTGQADNPTWCNCSAVTRETVLNLTDGSSTGPYWGELCQYAPPCDANPCFNNGTCINEGGPVYSCDCSETKAPYSEKPYEGARCEIDVTTPCDLNPCLNNGACTDTPGTPGGFTCDCDEAWSGYTCGIPPVDNCLLAGAVDVCGEFGRCVPSFNPTGVANVPYIQCVCLYGYTGDTCATAPAACSDNYEDAWQKRGVEQRQTSSEYCLNSGSCIGVGGDSAMVACLCVDPWVGSRCQWNSTIFAGASSFGASLMTVLLLAVVALF